MVTHLYDDIDHHIKWEQVHSLLKIQIPNGERGSDVEEAAAPSTVQDNFILSLRLLPLSSTKASPGETASVVP